MRSFDQAENKEDITSLTNPISRMAYVLAKITLKFNFIVHEFIELYKFHLVALARKQNPKYSIVELSARTGLDRRYVSNTLKNEELKKTNPKLPMVLNQIRQLCIKNKTNLIVKYGKNNSFEQICAQFSSGALTNNAISKELIRQGELIDQDRKYKVVNLTNATTANSLIYFNEVRMILGEIRKVCRDNKYLPKTGKINSFESICKKFQSGLFAADIVAQDLLLKKHLVDLGDKYQLVEWRYTAFNSSCEYTELLSEEMDRLANTVIYNSEVTEREEGDKYYQRNIFSTQVNPENYINLKPQITKILKTANLKIGKLVEKNETGVPKNTYPDFGASMFIFDGYTHGDKNK